MAGYFNFSKLSLRDAERIHAVVTATLVVVIAFFYAKLFAVMIGFYTEGVEDRVAKAKRPSAKVIVPTTASEDYSVIISRNIFNSKNEIPDDEILGTGQAYRRSTLDIELVGTIVVSDQTRSVAAIEIKGEKKVEPFVVGDTILSKAVVVNIARRKVILRNTASGELEYIGMKDEDIPSLSTTSVTSIKQLGQDRIVIDRKELNRSLENINELLTQARAVPNIENGVVNGFKLFGVQPGSLYQKLGAQNGDVIKAVNGVDIKDPATAMSLFQQLQSTNRLEFKIQRNGADKTFFVDIR